MPRAQQLAIMRHGGPEVFKQIEIAIPDLGPGAIMIRTHFAGINFADIMARVGLYPDAPKPPMVVGYEVSGVVEAVGLDVTGFKPGDKVLALTLFGGYSSRVVVPQERVRLVPEGVSLEAAAALPVVYLTAHLMLYKLGSLMMGDIVLIHGAGGGVGTAALQLARLKGARVFATASRGKHERVRSMGAELVVDPAQDDFVAIVLDATEGRGVDLVLDPQGPANFARSIKTLASLGKLVMFGIQSSVARRRKLSDLFRLLWSNLGINFSPIQLMNTNRGVHGFNLGHLWDRPEPVMTALDELVTWLGEGKISPEVDRVLAYRRVPEAHAYIQSRQNFGKVLLDFRVLTGTADQAPTVSGQ